MTIAALHRRLRKIEAARARPNSFFLAWGHTKDDAFTVLAQAQADGLFRQGDAAVAIVWPDPEPMPSARWVSFGQDGGADLSDRELELIASTGRTEAAIRERERAIAAQEDITGLDDTDFYIRHLRRTSKDLTMDLRFLVSHEVPEPEIHHAVWNGRSYDHCQCDRCLSGETALLPAHTRTMGVRNAWLARYLPGEMLFT
ncbi:hypothetical protein [Methylorubrum aminovorans]